MSRTGVKDDQEKNDLSLIHPSTVQGLGWVLTHGKHKYGRDNWQGLGDFCNRYIAGTLRHLMKVMAGERIDPESGLPHLWHVAANIHFLIWKDEKKHGKLTPKQIKKSMDIARAAQAKRRKS